jgi:alkaline phosphatase
MKMKKVVIYITGLAFLLCLFAPGVFAGEKAKNLIFMVPDGMGLADVVAARIYKYGVGNDRLALETLKVIGYQSTYSKNSIVTDSAAAASAWACGQKFNNLEISFHAESGEAPETILELAHLKGKSTGLVATSTITHATPAAFGAHVKNRRCENEIARQYIMETRVEVMLGGGKARFDSSKNDQCGVSGDFISAAQSKGYEVVYTRDELLKVKNAEKLLGLFSDEAMAPMYKRKDDNLLDSKEPTLSEMTKAALAILEKNDKGFFLLIEGSQVDWGNHANQMGYQMSEVIEFDNAVRVVLDWVKAKPSRENETLIIVIPDHETGGFAINGPYGTTFSEPGKLIEEGWTTRNHTGVDTIIHSQGPYSQYLGQAIDNTDVFHVMKAALKGEAYTRK